MHFALKIEIVIYDVKTIKSFSTPKMHVIWDFLKFNKTINFSFGVSRWCLQLFLKRLCSIDSAVLVLVTSLGR